VTPKQVAAELEQHKANLSTREQAEKATLAREAAAVLAHSANEEKKLAAAAAEQKKLDGVVEAWLLRLVQPTRCPVAPSWLVHLGAALFGSHMQYFGRALT
jgi:hypothetical protein